MSDYPPGFWVDADGSLNVSVEDILRARFPELEGRPIPPELEEEARTNILAALREQLPEAVLEERED